jgi:hypothetical protein
MFSYRRFDLSGWQIIAQRFVNSSDLFLSSSSSYRIDANWSKWFNNQGQYIINIFSIGHFLHEE